MLWYFNLEKQHLSLDVCGLHIGSWLECAKPSATCLPLCLLHTSIAEVPMNVPVNKCPTASERQGGLFQTYGMLNGSTWGCYFGPLPSTPLSWEQWDLWQPFCCGSRGFYFISDALWRWFQRFPRCHSHHALLWFSFRDMQNSPEVWGKKQEVF